MNSVRSNDISLKYQRCSTLGSKDIDIINSEFVAKTQFLYRVSSNRLINHNFSKSETFVLFLRFRKLYVCSIWFYCSVLCFNIPSLRSQIILKFHAVFETIDFKNYKKFKILLFIELSEFGSVNGFFQSSEKLSFVNNHNYINSVRVVHILEIK